MKFRFQMLLALLDKCQTKGGDQCKTPNANLPKEFLSGALHLIILRTRKNENLHFEKAGLRLGVDITNNPCDKMRKVKTNG